MFTLKSTQFRSLSISSTSLVAFILPCILLITVFLQIRSGALHLRTLNLDAYTDLSSDDPYKCRALLTEGQWLDTAAGNGSHLPYKHWQSNGCLIHQYHPVEIARCVGDRRIVFVGDSTVRQVYWALARKLNATKARNLEAKAPKQADQNLTSNGVKLEFIWDPYLNSSRLENELWTYSETRSGRRMEQPGAALMLLGAGAWFARWFDSSHSFPRFQLAIENVTAYTEPYVPFSAGIARSGNDGIGDQVFLSPVPMPKYDQLEGSRREDIQPGEMEKMNAYLRTLGRTSNILWSYLVMVDQQPDTVELGGLHVHENVADAKADILLNLRCNAILDRTADYPFDRTCCSNYQSVDWEQQGVFAATLLLALSMLWTVAQGKEPNAIQSALLFTFAVLVYCHIADRTQIFDKSKKHFVWDQFHILCGAVLLVGLVSVRRSAKPGDIGKYKDQPFLARDQTEEWKGWMQFAVLIYHYTGASSVLQVYQVIRVLVASYLFLTGFGHTCYFLQKADFSFRRVANVLVRLNFLSCALPYAMGTHYLFYYFAPLVTFWFLVVYLTMRVGVSKNDNGLFVLSKIVIAAGLTTAMLRTPAFDVLFSILRTLFRIEWDVHEWKFRLALDRYVVFIGMIVALIFERTNTATASGTVMPSLNLLRIPAIVLSVVAIPTVHIVYSAFTSKTESNMLHPYLSLIPILAFITLRNATPTMRNYHSTFFAWLGTFSLETFVLQYHIWLAADTKGLLSLGLFRGDGRFWHDRWRDFVVLTPVFFSLSWRLADATSTLTKAILHVDEVGEDADVESFPDDGPWTEKISGSIRLGSTVSRVRGVLWAKDLRARLGMLFLTMWALNLMW